MAEAKLEFTGSAARIEAEMTKVPSTKVKVEDVSIAKQILGLIESLEEHDDVQKVYANFDIPDNVMEEAAKDM